MMLDKSIILKGLAGVTAVGSLATCGFVFKDQIKDALSSSPQGNESVDNQGANEQQGVGETAPRATVRTGDQAPGTGSSASIPQVTPVDDRGIPTSCTDTCELNEDDLKKIKFEALEDAATDDLTVENFPSSGNKLTLKIDSRETNNKRYIFNNPSTSNPIAIKKKSDQTKTVTLGTGKTKFTVNAGKLKERTLNTYGLPNDCSSSCTLTSTDLEDIGFEGLDGAITASPTNQTVSLTIDSSVSEHKRYIFSNGSNQPITLRNSSSTQTINMGNGKTRFKENNNKLKKIELDIYGLPNDCTPDCKLTTDDLKYVKFPGFSGDSESTVTGLDDQVISLQISNENYTFADDKGKAVKITQGNVTITLKDSSGTFFHVEGGKLVSGEKKTEGEKLNETLKSAGFPTDNDCSFEKGNVSQPLNCQLTKDKFKNLKFNNLNDDGMDESRITITDKITAKIEKDGNGLKITFSNVSNSGISVDKKVNGGIDTIYVTNNSQFTINSKNKLEKKTNS